MPFAPKNWESEPDPLGVLQGETEPTSKTPLNAAGLTDLEERLSDYTDDEVKAEREAREAADASLKEEIEAVEGGEGGVTEKEVEDYVAAQTGSLVPKSVVDAKGDLLVGTADNTVGRLAAGSNGQVLTADSGSAAGVKWAAPPEGGGSALVLNVLDYGATGDGETDDAKAIQDALDAAAGAGGGVVFVPAGDYKLGSKLVLEDFVILRGTGRGSRLFPSTDAHIIEWARYDEGGEDAGTVGSGLHDLCIDGAGKAGAVLIDGLAYRVTNVWFEDVGGGVISDMTRDEPHQGMEAFWTDVWMMDCGTFEFWGPHDSQLSNIIVRRAGSGACIVGGGATVWTGCHTYGNAEYGILAYGGSQWLNCQAEGTQKAKLRIMGDGVRWIGGRIFSAGGEDGGVGIEWGDGESSANSAQIYGVEIAGCTEPLLFTYPGNGSVVSGFVWGAEGAEAIHGEPAAGEIDWRGLVVRPPMVYGFAEAEDAQGKGFRNHGEEGWFARPLGFASVEWFGSAEPEHAQVGDTWIDPS